jgi:SAM-dependent methyltransferase
MVDIEALYDAEQSFGPALSNCVACGSANSALWQTKAFAASARTDVQAFNIFRCRNCGTGFLNPPPSADYLKKVYAVSGHGLTKAITLAEVEESERLFPNSSIDAERIARLGVLANSSTSKRALDVGSGYGWGTKALMARGYEVVAINPSALEAVVFQDMNNFLPIPVMLDDYVPDGRFGVVYLSQVLEHIVDPRPTVARLASLLEPGGALVIAVPNFESISVKLLGTKDNSCLWVPEHVNYFTKRGLVTLLQQEGLTVKAVSNVSRVRHDAISTRLKLTGFLGSISCMAVKYLQILPCIIADALGFGMYINIVATKERSASGSLLPT